MRAFVALTLLALGTGCTARATYYVVQKELATDCVKHCDKLDMRLGAVVIISSSAGCVCEPRGSASDTPRAGAAAAAGGAAIAAEHAAQQRRQTESIPSQPSIPSIRTGAGAR